MPVKSVSGTSTIDQKKNESGTLSKRKIKLPDGRYMIFYTDEAVKLKQEEKKA